MTDNDYLCSLVKSVAHDGMLVLELGVEKGNSILAMAGIVHEYKGHIIGIDTWENDKDYCEFLEKAIPLSNVIAAYRCNLFSFDYLLGDDTFDLIHFDACYKWPDVKLMILRYWQKLKTGGIACGHGGDMFWGKLSQENHDYLSIFPDCITVSMKPVEEIAHLYEGKDVMVHTNLARALYEIFHDEYEINFEHTFWSIKK